MESGDTAYFVTAVLTRFRQPERQPATSGFAKPETTEKLDTDKMLFALILFYFFFFIP